MSPPDRSGRADCDMDRVLDGDAPARVCSSARLLVCEFPCLVGPAIPHLVSCRPSSLSLKAAYMLIALRHCDQNMDCQWQAQGWPPHHLYRCIGSHLARPWPCVGADPGRSSSEPFLRTQQPWSTAVRPLNNARVHGDGHISLRSTWPLPCLTLVPISNLPTCQPANTV